MRTTMNTSELKFEDFLSGLDKYGTSEWITVYASSTEGLDWFHFYCVLMRNDQASKSLSYYSWDAQVDDNRPGFSFSFENGKEITTYSRGWKNSIEPLIIWRNFHGMKEGYWDISEEFRLYFNLYEETNRNKYIKIDDSGNDEEVIKIEGRSIKIKLRLIKEFLAVRQMQLAMFFSLDRFSEKTMNELGIEEYREERKGNDFIYSIGARPFTFGDNRNIQSQGYLVGKKLIAGLRNFKPSRFGSEQRQFLDFIINVDDEGKPVTHTCDAERLSNYFGKNPGAPHYLTPVNFRKDVLAKYYAQPGKYSVGDGYLICGGLWSLRMDNNHSEFVMIFLGDLGLLSHDEQMHWRSFNIPAKGKMSHTAWVRGFQGQFANPQKSDLFFKQKLAVFQENWQKMFGWTLLKPLSKGDEHFLTSLRVPLTNDHKEFDEQVLALVKVLID